MPILMTQSPKLPLRANAVPCTANLQFSRILSFCAGIWSSLHILSIDGDPNRTGQELLGI